MEDNDILMKKKYSISAIKTFEQCRCKFKLQHIDKIKRERKTIESVMGLCVHKAMEMLYTFKKNGRILSLEETLKIYEDTWDSEFTEDIIIAKKELTAEDYRNVGRKCVTDYYESHKPFDEMNIIGLETDDTLELADGIKYYVKMDKFACKGDTFYVCDYKTNKDLKTQEEADSDIQLAMYAAWVRKKYNTDKIKLVWHMVRFDRDVVSERTGEQLDRLTDEITRKIKEIQACTDWSTNPGALCDYCEYRDICPQFSHIVKVDKDIEEKHFTEDEGAKLVDEYVKAEAELAKFKPDIEPLEERMESLKKDIVLFAKQYGYKSVGGTEKQANVKIEKKATIPKDKVEEVISQLEKEGKLGDYQMFDKSKLEKEIASGEAGPYADYAEMSESSRVTFAKKK